MSSLQTSRRRVSDIRLRSSDRYNNVTNTNTGQWQLTSDQPAPAAWSEEIRGEIQLQRPGQPEWPGAANSYENKQENVGKLSVPGWEWDLAVPGAWGRLSSDAGDATQSSHN